MYLPAIVSTVAAWVLGLFIDANILTDSYIGFLELRVLLPVLVMGIFVLRAVNSKNKAE